jgi:hypothetical protein
MKTEPDGIWCRTNASREESLDDPGTDRARPPRAWAEWGTARLLLSRSSGGRGALPEPPDSTRSGPSLEVVAGNCAAAYQCVGLGVLPLCRPHFAARLNRRRTQARWSSPTRTTVSHDADSVRSGAAAILRNRRSDGQFKSRNLSTRQGVIESGILISCRNDRIPRIPDDPKRSLAKRAERNGTAIMIPIVRTCRRSSNNRQRASRSRLPTAAGRHCASAR